MKPRGAKTDQEVSQDELTNVAKLPYVRLHAHAVVGVLLKEGQPHLHGLGMPIPDLNQAAYRNTLEIFLALLEDEVRLWHRPALRKSWQRDGSEGREAQVIGGSQGEVAEELKRTD